MMNATCPVCGAPLSQIEQFLAETTAGVQCRNCWTHIHAGMPARPQKNENSKRAAHAKVSRRAS